MASQAIDIVQITTYILMMTFILSHCLNHWFQKKRTKKLSSLRALVPSLAAHEYVIGKIYDEALFNAYLWSSLNPIDLFQNKLSSQNRDLCAADLSEVEGIYDYIKDIILHKSIPVHFFEFEKISDVMIRCHKLVIMNDNQHFEIRFNIFLNCAETFIHNHQSHFVSVCISGGFVHDSWVCNTESTAVDCVYHKYSRIDANKVEYQGKCGGEIRHVHRSVHQKNNKYFLDRDAFHTVCTPHSILYHELKMSYDSCGEIEAKTKNKIMQNEAITFVVRSKVRRPNKTTIVSDKFVSPESTVNAGGKTRLSHSDKIKTIQLLYQSMLYD